VTSERPSNWLHFSRSKIFRVVASKSGVISEIEVWLDAKAEILGDNLEFAVRTTGLNFKDLLVMMNSKGLTLFPSDFNREPGFDFAGIATCVGPQVTRSKVGDAVFGFSLQLTWSIPSHVVSSIKSNIARW
jgi:NADPH:quinone reductase-like Zn-dependent oxidoreductase